MTIPVSAQTVPLRTDDGGVIRVGNTRVSLDSVVHTYQQGATAEQISEDFPVLDLADIHMVISYYLRHAEDVNEYLAAQRQEAAELHTRIQADPKTQIIRQRLLEQRARRTERHAASDS